MDQYYLVVVCVICAVLTSIFLGYDIYIALKLQQLAYSGDAAAAKRIILPCYKPLIKGLVIFNALFAVALALTFTNNRADVHSIVTYYFFSLNTVYCITPVMLVQTSVSVKAFWYTFYTIAPWWALCTIFWCIATTQHEPTTSFVFNILFILAAALVPFLFALGILTKVLSSRVQIGSVSNRNGVEVLLIYSFCFGVTFVIGTIAADNKFTVDTVMTFITFVVNQIFPFALYRTLLADTKYWRGLGRHNQAGMDVHNILRESGINVDRPTMELHVVSSSFQNMMADINDITVDFAYLQLERMIGEGATSKVFCGKFKRKLVAIKLSTPPEITEDVMDVFVSEAKIASQLKHKNIVEFVGICVRPPQIGMVFEFCEGGNLKTNLQKNKAKWSVPYRIAACLDASRAINCLHCNQFIHRDIKAENFFVGKKMVVKLGDFGETTRFRSFESTSTRRMTILGTVAFMAPELVEGKRHYTESVDIYALGITFWEIWTFQDPYDGCSTFNIYEKVKQGFRLEIPNDVPEGFRELLESTWQEDSMKRPRAIDLVQSLERILSDTLGGGSLNRDDESESSKETKFAMLKRASGGVDSPNTSAKSESGRRPTSSRSWRLSTLLRRSSGTTQNESIISDSNTSDVVTDSSNTNADPASIEMRTNSSNVIESEDSVTIESGTTMTPFSQNNTNGDAASDVAVTENQTDLPVVESTNTESSD